nr:site-specific DNA-methyltransferase [uncultured Dysosmobacter sp.]
MNTEMKMEVRALADLRPAEYNPRVALTPEDKEYQDIKRSIETFGYVDPIIVNADGTIIGGHQRYTVLSDMGYETAQVVVVDLDKQDEKALNIALNKITGEWDEIKLKDLLLELDLNEYDLRATGFSAQEIDDLCIRLEKDLAAEDDGFEPEKEREAIEEPITKRGDIWILGRHRLMCGDSTSAEDMAALMGGEEADLIITDPPYNVDYSAKLEFMLRHQDPEHKHRDPMQIQNDKMEDEDFQEFLEASLGNTANIARPGAAIYCFHASMKVVPFFHALQAAGFKISQFLIWEKNTFALGMLDYHWRHEPIFYGWKEGAAHYFIEDCTQDTVLLEDDIDLDSMRKQDLITYIEQLRESFRDRTTVLYENKPLKNDIHPTMKPVPLIGKLMKNSSKPGWNVADPFGGGGSTLMAAEQLNRTAFIMEIDEGYCDVIIRRWEAFTGEKAVLQGETIGGLDIEL